MREREERDGVDDTQEKQMKHEDRQRTDPMPPPSNPPKAGKQKKSKLETLMESSCNDDPGRAEV